MTMTHEETLVFIATYSAFYAAKAARREVDGILLSDLEMAPAHYAEKALRHAADAVEQYRQKHLTADQEVPE